MFASVLLSYSVHLLSVGLGLGLALCWRQCYLVIQFIWCVGGGEIQLKPSRM